MLRARQTHAAPVQAQYSYGYGNTAPPALAPVQAAPPAQNSAVAMLTQALQQQQQGGGNANLMTLINSLDPATLQTFLASINKGQQQQPQSPHTPQVPQFHQAIQQPQNQLAPDLAALLSAANGHGRTAAPQAQGYGAPMGMPGQPGMGLAGMYGQQMGQPQMQNQHTVYIESMFIRILSP